MLDSRDYIELASYGQYQFGSIIPTAYPKLVKPNLEALTTNGGINIEEDQAVIAVQRGKGLVGLATYFRDDAVLAIDEIYIDKRRNLSNILNIIFGVLSHEGSRDGFSGVTYFLPNHADEGLQRVVTECGFLPVREEEIGWSLFLPLRTLSASSL